MVQMRRTFCRICEPLCPLLAEVDDGKIVKLHPDKEHPISKGFACHKGLSFLDVHNDPDRVNFPLFRTGAREDFPAEYERRSWEDAFADIGGHLRRIRDEHGPDAIAVYFGNPVSLNSNAFPLAATLGAKIGTKRNFNSGTQDTTNKPAAIEAIFGTSMLFPIPDFANTSYLLCLGANPKISHWTYASVHRPLNVLQDITKRGGKVQFINPRKIESSNKSTGEVTQIKPDSDVYFLAAMLHEIDQKGWFDTNIVETYGRNIQALRAFISRYSPERVETVTGIPADVIKGIASEYSSAQSACVYMATGVNQGRQGTLAYWLLMMLSFVSGNLGREGGDYYGNGVYANARPVAVTPSILIDTEDGYVESIAGALPGYALAPMIEQANTPIRALIVLSGNPILSIPGEEAMRSAFPKLDFMVHVDLYRNATGEYADYILPAADFLERPECNLSASSMQPKPFVQYVDEVVEPQFERRDDWWIISRLQQELGVPSALDLDDPDKLGRAKKILARKNLTIDQLRNMPGQSAIFPQPARSTILDSLVCHPDGKIDCCPSAFGNAIDRCSAIFLELEAEPSTQLKLISLRTNYMHNSNLANMASLKRSRFKTNSLHINSEDASRLGISDNDKVRIFNSFGSIETHAKIDDSLRLGAVAMSHGYGHSHSYGLSNAVENPGANVNALMPTGVQSHEPLSNMAHLTGINVDVELFSR